MKKTNRVPKPVIEARLATEARRRVLEKTGNRNPFSEIALAERIELDTLARLAS
jgi:hypothetical protein